jgi:hypothetical protein
MKKFLQEEPVLCKWPKQPMTTQSRAWMKFLKFSLPLMTQQH